MKFILNSQPNFRDLGGVKNKNGVSVKEKMIFRSGFIDSFDANEIDIVKSLNLNEVIDLRTREEIDLIGAGNYPEFIHYQNIIFNTGNITKALIPIFEKGEFHRLDADILDKIYFDLITNFKNEMYQVYSIILNAKKAVMFHCSHGKDRTGIISALLLDLLEVDREHIYEDYILSNKFRKKENEYQIQKIKDNFSKQFKRDVTDEEFKPVEALFYCHRKTLENIFGIIDESYKGIENYFENELSFSKEEIQKLKQKYLNE